MLRERLEKVMTVLLLRQEKLGDPQLDGRTFPIIMKDGEKVHGEITGESITDTETTLGISSRRSSMKQCRGPLIDPMPMQLIAKPDFNLPLSSMNNYTEPPVEMKMRPTITHEADGTLAGDTFSSLLVPSERCGVSLQNHYIRHGLDVGGRLSTHEPVTDIHFFCLVDHFILKYLPQSIYAM